MLSYSLVITDLISYLVFFVILIPILLTYIMTLRMRKNVKKFLIILFFSMLLSIILSNETLKYVINEVIDLKEQKTEIIYAKTEDLEIYSKVYKRTKERTSTIIKYYLNIRNGEYIIQLLSNEATAIDRLLYNKKTLIFQGLSVIPYIIIFCLIVKFLF